MVVVCEERLEITLSKRRSADVAATEAAGMKRIKDL